MPPSGQIKNATCIIITRSLYCTFWNPVTPTRENGPVPPSLPVYIPEREGLRVGRTMIPLAVLNYTKIITKTHPRCISSDAQHAFKMGFLREYSDSWLTSQNHDKLTTPKWKPRSLSGPQSVHASGSVNLPFESNNKKSDKTKKKKTHYWS